MTVVVGFDPERDRAEMERLQMPSLSLDYLATTLARNYIDAGFELAEINIGGFDITETTWARRLKSNTNRSVIRLVARAAAYFRTGEL
ncbi:MAG: hypothetical protein ABR501_02005 [Pyrinomonadaceae bacterium]